MMSGMTLFRLMVAAVTVTVTQAVKIVNLRVPSQYILDKYENSEPLILDCEYDLPVIEKELVLKWYLNDQLIYQWISTAPPRIFVHNLIRNSINYTVVEPPNRLRTLPITKPTINMTGMYTCSVGTFQSEDKRSSYLQIIVPESEFIMNVREANDGSNDISVQCSVFAIYPEPKLVIRIGENNDTFSELITEAGKDVLHGLWDIYLSGKIKRKNIPISPSDVHCILIIPNTTYIKHKNVFEFTNQGPQLSAQTIVVTIIIVTLMFISTFLLNSG